jgi:hypothetical protein
MAKPEYQRFPNQWLIQDKFKLSARITIFEISFYGSQFNSFRSSSEISKHALRNSSVKSCRSLCSMTTASVGLQSRQKPG